MLIFILNIKSTKESINIAEFFLNETMAQLQLAMFGFSNNFQQSTNLNLRRMFSGRDISYVKKFIPQFFRELKTGNGPLSEYMLERFEELQFKKNSEMIGNSLIFSFAGHDTTAHTLSWLIYELSKNKIVQTS